MAELAFAQYEGYHGIFPVTVFMICNAPSTEPFPSSYLIVHVQYMDIIDSHYHILRGGT